MTKVLRTRQSNCPPLHFHGKISTLHRARVRIDALITATKVCCICRFVGCPTVIAVPQGLDISTMTAKIMKSLLCTQAGSLTKEVVLQLHCTKAEQASSPEPCLWQHSCKTACSRAGPCGLTIFALQTWDRSCQLC